MNSAAKRGPRSPTRRELLESERRLRAIIQAEPECVKVVDRAGRLLEMNPAGLAMLEADSLAAVQTKPLLDFLLAEHRDPFLALHRRVIDGEAGTLEFEISGLKGARRWLETHATPLRSATGEVEMLLGITRDITKRKQVETALLDTTAQLRMLVESSPLAIYTRDPKGLLTSWNPAAEKMFGWTAAEVLGKPLPTVPDEQRAASDELRLRLLKGESFLRVEGERRRRDGSTIHIESCLAPLREASGNVSGIIAVVTDVSERRSTQAKLKESESINAAILKSSLDAIVTIDGEGRVVEFNPAAEVIFRYPSERAVGEAVAELIIPPRLRDAHRHGLARLGATGESRALGRRLELQAMRSDGSEFPVELAITAITAGPRPLYTAFIRDISERKAADEGMRRLNRVYAVLSGINGLIVRVRNRDDLYREACRIAVEHGGFRMAWLGLVDRPAGRIQPVAWHGTGPDYIDLMPLGLGEHPAQEYGLAGLAVNERRAMISNDMTRDPRVRLRVEAQERRVCSLAILPLLRDGEAVAVLALYASEVGVFDAHEMKLLEELAGDIAFALDHIEKADKVDYLAYYDQITGLPNRMLFHERLAQDLLGASASGGKVALLQLDIDRFRSVNDALGRQAGDALLREIAGRLSKAAGPATWIARTAADNFSIVASGAGAGAEREVAQLAEHMLLEGFAPAFSVGAGELRVSAKLGIALFPEDGVEGDTLFRSAEAALKKAKTSGEKYLFHASGMTERAAQGLSLETSLRRAIEKEEFVLHYQPKVDVGSRAIVGVEALIRWHSPEGLIAPAEFIPLLEETGLILEVGRWALYRAAQDHLHWFRQGLKTPRIAVNISPIQLRQRDFVRVVERAILDGLAPTGLDLEITESLMMEDVGSSIAILEGVRGLGVQIAIDDFGTGYSSLGYLARLPVQSLKIDRSFIKTMQDDGKAMTLVSTIVSLAHSLRLKVVAEGVETEEQAEMLRLLRCDEMQGYLFSKPLPLEEMTKLLRPRGAPVP